MFNFGNVKVKITLSWEATIPVSFSTFHAFVGTSSVRNVRA